MSAISPDAAALDIAGLSVSYRRGRTATVALHALDLRIMPGEIVAVVGESGSGKSTLALSIIGLLHPNATRTAASIAVAGHEIGALSERAMRQVRGGMIGLVPQDPSVSLDPVKTIGDQIAEVLTVHRAAPRPRLRALVLEMLREIGLDQPELRARQYPHELSGGMKQRVAIARALVLRPEILILDEPVSALDVSVQARIIALLLQLQARFGLTYLFISHDLGVVNLIAHDVAVMKSGRVVEQGAVETVFRSPKSPYTQALLDAIPGRMLPSATPIPAQG